MLEYKLKSEGDNLLIYKIIEYLKPRSFREIRLSLAWPENQEANRIVSDISDAISIILNKIKFSKVKTIFDEVGVEKNKLNNIRLKKLSFWDKLTIYFPERWVLKEDKKNKFVNVEIKKEKNLNLFFEILQIKVDNNKKDNDQIISNFLKEVTKDVVLEKQTLIKAEEDNYIFSFDTLEKNNLTEFQNHIWYRIFIKEGNILMISFVFNYKVEDILIGEVYYNKINELIKSSELN
jgi:hypothetical protein